MSGAWNLGVLSSLFDRWTIWHGGAALLTALGLLFGAYYLFCSFVLYRISRKIRPCSFWGYLLPVVRVFLLALRARVSPWVVLGTYAPLCLVLLGRDLDWFRPEFWGLVSLAFALRFVCRVALWGRVAQRFGLDFWLWGLLVALIPDVFICQTLLALEPTLVSDRKDLREPEAEGAPSGGFSQRGRGTLLCLNGPYPGQRLPLPKEGLRLGREPQGNDLVLPLAGVSRFHARLVPCNGGWGLEDLASTNGTYLEEEGGWFRVTGLVSLREGARFRVGSAEVEFELLHG